MKQILAFILAIFFLFINIGAVSHAHICHGNISSFTLSENTKKCDNEIPSNSNCCSSKENKALEYTISKKECCIDLTSYIKYQTITETTTVKVTNYITTFQIPQQILSQINASPIEHSAYKLLLDFSPPIQTPKYTLLCSYIFYG